MTPADWIEFSRLSTAFQQRFGRSPPSILTFEGALLHMRDALGESAAEEPPPDDGGDRPPEAHPRRPPGTRPSSRR